MARTDHPNENTAYVKPKPEPPSCSWWACETREQFNEQAAKAADRMKIIPVESSQARREFGF